MAYIDSIEKKAGVAKAIKSYLGHLSGKNVERALNQRSRLYGKLKVLDDSLGKKVKDLYNRYNPQNRHLRSGWWLDDAGIAGKFIEPPRREFPSYAPLDAIRKRISNVDDILKKAISRRNKARAATAVGVVGTGIGMRELLKGDGSSKKAEFHGKDTTGDHNMTRYEKGFIEKCAEYGVDGSELLKQAIALGGPPPPKGMLGSSAVNSAQQTGKTGLLDKLVAFGRVMPSGTHVKMTPFGMMPASMGDVMDYNKKRMERLHAFATGTGMVGQHNLRRIFGSTPASTVS